MRKSLFCAFIALAGCATAGEHKEMDQRPLFTAKATLLWHEHTEFGDYWNAKVIYVASLPDAWPTTCFKVAEQIRHITCFYITKDGDAFPVDTRDYDEDKA